MPAIRRLVLAAALLTPVWSAAPTVAMVSIEARTDLPSLDEVIAGAIRAVGGRAAVDKVRTLHSVWEMDFGGQKMVNDTSWSRSGGRLAKMSTPMGEMERGTDGKLFWQKTAFGYSLIEGKEAEEFEGQANLYMIVLEPEKLAKEESKSIEVAGKEVFDGRECYRVHYVDKSDDEGDVFFEVATGLPIGMRQVNATPQGRQTTTVLLKDWKEEQGVKFFRKMEMATSGAVEMPMMSVATTALEVNTLDDSAFAAPDEVKRLAESAEAEPAAGDIPLSDLTPEQQAQAKEMVDGLKAAGSADVVRSAMSSLEQAARYAPPADRKMYQYITQELKKHLAAIGGGR